MKIGILTYYGVHNHGAVLQANGLKSVLERLGHDVYFLTFERGYEYIPVSQTRKYKISVRSILFYFKYILGKGIGNVLYNYKKHRTLRIFRTLSFNLDTGFDTFNGDIIVIGSDEVFSLEIGYNPMMYGYGLHTKKIVSYAGSFGPTTIENIDEKEKRAQIRKGLLEFSAISVRDRNSQFIVEELCQCSAQIVCDPVILYGYEKEMSAFWPKESDYIVVYAYDSRMNESEEVVYIKDYAKKHKFKLYSVGYYHRWCNKNIDVSPNELLGWIKHAKLIITDTFHGSVMAIICNTPMVVKIRGNANKLAYLLNEYSLCDRIVETFAELPVVAKKTINFAEVNKKLKEKRAESMDYLKKAIEE